MALDLNGNKLYSVTVGPKGEAIKAISTDGLVVHLDAQNKNSYGGTGNIWTDLKGNYNSVLYNSPTYNSTQPANIQLNGSNQFIELGSFFTFNYFTISTWVNAGSSQTTYADIFDNNHTGVRNLVCQQNANNLNQYDFTVIGASNYSTTGFFTLTSNTWTYLSFTFDNDKVRGYINGSLFATGGSCTPNWQASYFRLGQWGGGGRNWNGKYGNFMIYNRALPVGEITQNFNAQKARFGL